MTSSIATKHDPRWQAVMNRDSLYVTPFVYAVKSTGIYCRAGCPSRLPKPDNITFYDTSQQAAQAGYRACQRCKPDGAPRSEENAALIARSCRMIEQAETPPPLESLAKATDMSQSHFHRLFKTITGVTPKAYATAHRLKKMRQALETENISVTQAIYDAGFNTSSRFYENSKQGLGMSATDYKKGGKDMTIHFAVGQCSLGAILVARSEKGICAITLDDDPVFLVRDLQDRFPNATLIGGNSAFEQLVAQVIGFVESPTERFTLPLDIQGTAFQQRVWQALQDIPAGKTLSYSELAAYIGKPAAVRAVATACASNKIAVAIPCHRIVRTDGSLSGYRWGVERKEKLLKKEVAAKVI